MLFGAVFATLALVRAVADLTSKPAQWEALCALVLLALLIGSAATLVIVPALSIGGWPSRLAVLAFGGVVATQLAARGLRLGRARERDGVVLVDQRTAAQMGAVTPAVAAAGMDGRDPRQRAGRPLRIELDGLEFRAWPSWAPW